MGRHQLACVAEVVDDTNIIIRVLYAEAIVAAAPGDDSETLFAVWNAIGHSLHCLGQVDEARSSFPLHSHP